MVTGNTIEGNRAYGLVLYFDCNAGSGSIGAEGIANNVIRHSDVGVQFGGNCVPNPLRLTSNDVYDNASFELRNESPVQVNAAEGYWGEPTSTELNQNQPNLSRIFDQKDNSSYGQVLIQSIRGTPARQAPRFVTQPQSVAALPGETTTLSATADGSAPITYQWYRNSSAVPQATSQDLTLANLDANKAGDYFLVAENAAGRTTSAVAQVILILQPMPPILVLRCFQWNQN